MKPETEETATTGSNAPERALSLGIFKPKGAAVVALRSAADLQALTDELLAQGYTESTLTPYSPSAMRQEIDAAMAVAGLLAQFGQELHIAKARRVLAEHGCSFLVVDVPDAAAKEQLKEVINRLGAPTAQHYGLLFIEELTERTASEVQFVDTSPQPAAVPADTVLPPTR